MKKDKNHFIGRCGGEDSGWVNDARGPSTRIESECKEGSSGELTHNRREKDRRLLAWQWQLTRNMQPEITKLKKKV